MARSTEAAPAASANRPPRPQDLPRYQRDRRRRIVLAALDLLEHYDYEQIQMRNVAEHAGAALGTVYRYFGSKEHLYAAVMLEWSKQYPVERVHRTGATDAERLKAVLRKAIRAFEKRPQFIRLEIMLEMSPDPDVREIFEEFSQRHGQVIVDSLTSLPPDEAQAVADVVNCVLGAQLRAWAFERKTMQKVYASVDRAVDLVFEGPTRIRANPSRGAGPRKQPGRA